MEAFPNKDTEVPLFPCKHCQVKMKKEALIKHEPICLKVFRGNKTAGWTKEEKEQMQRQRDIENKKHAVSRK